MSIRKFNPDDLDNMERVTSGFPVPSPENIIIGRAVEYNDTFAGYGVVKHMGEAIFAIDESLPKLTRARALKELMKVAIFGAKNARCSQLHVFVKDKKLADLLKKHYNFKETNDIVLARDL